LGTGLNSLLEKHAATRNGLGEGGRLEGNGKIVDRGQRGNPLGESLLQEQEKRTGKGNGVEGNTPQGAADTQAKI